MAGLDLGALAATPGRRMVAAVGAIVVFALCVLVSPYRASAAPLPAKAPGDQCTVQQWGDPSNLTMCIGKLGDLTQSELDCLSAPEPDAPDSGMAGWFASEPASADQSGLAGLYSLYGYAGYDFSEYDQGCVSSLTHPVSSFEDTMANGEFMIATSILGAAGDLRQYAWNPGAMWGWADSLVQDTTTSLYKKVFTVFGAITLAIVGLYLLWRSRQSDMSNAVTTAGWAIFVMVVVTAIAAWPVRSAHIADSALVGGLNVVHSAIGSNPDSLPASDCLSPDACIDRRDPSTRADDDATYSILYENWLRGELGSADSPTAIKYGMALYDAKTLSWDDEANIKNNPDLTDSYLQDKREEWAKVANQIKTEDPEAYTYLQGQHGMDRIGAGLIAVVSALFFALFDVTASVLVLLGFLIFRWAVIAAPLLGTVGILRPASAGLRRLANAVVAALFNVIIFGTGAAIYLYAVDVIMSTTTLPGWLQVVLVLLVGIVGWLLLRPYRRITRMAGGEPAGALWRDRFARESRRTERGEAQGVSDAGMRATVRRGTSDAAAPAARPESRSDDLVTVGGPAAPEASGPAPPRPETSVPRRRAAGEWTDPDIPDLPDAPGYTIYRPAGSSVPAPAAADRPVRPARRPESSTVGG